MITWLGWVTWPGAASANSSVRLLGSCTMPVTRQVVPAACQVPPTCVPYKAATWLVSATWPGPAGLLRAQAAAQTVMAERLRIARELHDIVAHSIGIIAIQAGAGRRVFDARPAEARDALAAIEATSRETLSGLRRMVTGLRLADPGPGPGQAPLDPAPGLAGHRAAGRHDPGGRREGRRGLARQSGAAPG